ncbi:MAG: hypothetical protein K1Y36_14395 [Blastocatellia bacterium]|nr:hypothetical protein [Blastocatellia bacterium]
MSEPKIILRNITLPTRCEICHQADRFNPETGICQRCQSVFEEHQRTAAAVPNFPQATFSLTPWGVVGRIFLASGLGFLISFASCGFGSASRFEGMFYVGILALLLGLAAFGIGVIASAFLMLVAICKSIGDAWASRHDNSGK